MGESQTTQSVWWQVLKDQGMATIMQWIGSASPQFEQLLVGRDLSWVVAWLPTAMAAQKLSRTFLKVLYELQHALRHNTFEQGFGLGQDAAYKRILEDYQALLDSVPRDVTWLESLQNLDDVYMSWLHDEQARETFMSILSRAETYADAFLAQAVDLLLSPQTPAELHALTQFFDRAQVILERILEQVMVSKVSCFGAPQEATVGSSSSDTSTSLTETREEE